MSANVTKKMERLAARAGWLSVRARALGGKARPAISALVFTRGEPIGRY